MKLIQFNNLTISDLPGISKPGKSLNSVIYNVLGLGETCNDDSKQNKVENELKIALAIVNQA